MLKPADTHLNPPHRCNVGVLSACEKSMNKFQAMAQIMVLLNEDDLLKSGSHVYKAVRKMVSGMIDRLGPDAALLEVVDRKSHILDQIKVLCMWNKSKGRRPFNKLSVPNTRSARRRL